MMMVLVFLEPFVALFTARSCASETEKPGDTTQEAAVECEDRLVEGCEDGASCCNSCSRTCGLMMLVPVSPSMIMTSM